MATIDRPTPLDVAVGLTAVAAGMTTEPYTFERFQEVVRHAGIPAGAEQLKIFFELPATLQDWLWADLVHRVMQRPSRVR